MIKMKLFTSEAGSSDFFLQLKGLVSSAYGSRFSEDDWQHCLGGTHIAVMDAEKLISHASVVPRKLFIGDHQYSCGYVEAVATLPGHQRLGFASLALQRVNSVIADQYEIGALSTSSKDLYKKLGWVDWEGPSFIIERNNWFRSESEDAGIMILRTARTPEMDLDLKIACEARSGDAW